MKTRHILIVLAMCLSNSCSEPVHHFSETSKSVFGNIPAGEEKIVKKISPLQSIDYHTPKNFQGHIPIYSYGSSTLLIRADNPEEGSQCFAGVSLEEEREVWYLPNLHPSHFWRADGYLHDNLFVVMSTNQVHEDPNNATLYCFDLNTQTIVWSKDFWQYPRSWCGVVGVDGYSYHYENRIDDSLFIKTDIQTGESTILYQTPTYYAPTGTNPTIASYDGSQYIIFYMWDLRKTREEQNVVVSVYNITNNELTYQDYLPTIQTMGISISQPKDDVIYITHGRTMHCFNFVEGKIVWTTTGFYSGLVVDVILLDNGDVLRVGHADMSYVDGNNGYIRWKKRYDENDGYEWSGDYLPRWAIVHDNHIYLTYSTDEIDVRELLSGEYLGTMECGGDLLPWVFPLKHDNGFFVATINKILKFPYVR